MPELEELDLTPTDDKEEKVAAFRNYSRQALYAALLENDDWELYTFDEGIDVDQTGAEPEPANTDEESDEEPNIKRLRQFSRYLLQQVGSELLPPEELTVDEWSELAEEIFGQSDQETVDLPALAERLYARLKRELRIERERLLRSV